MIRYIFILLTISTQMLLASNDLFMKGNQHYQQGEFDKAIEAYESILNSNIESSELYYNLANSYYKSGSIARSILNYERALQIDPGNEDYKFNLQIAKLKTIDKIEPLPEMFKFWNDFANSMNSDFWSILAIISSVTSGLFLILFLFQRSNILILLALFFFAGIIFFTSIASTRSHFEKDGNFGIIMTNTSYVKSSPKNGSTDLFILHEGAKCEILDKVGEWVEVRIEDGNKGWIEASTMEVI